MKTYLISFYEKDDEYVADHMLVTGTKADAVRAAITVMRRLPPRIWGFHITEEKHGGY